MTAGSRKVGLGRFAMRQSLERLDEIDVLRIAVSQRKGRGRNLDGAVIREIEYERSIHLGRADRVGVDRSPAPFEDDFGERIDSGSMQHVNQQWAFLYLSFESLVGKG